VAAGDGAGGAKGGSSGGMSDPVNVRDLAVGTRVVLGSGAEVEIVANPRDGVWVFGRYLSAGDGEPGMVGEEEMIFAQDVVEVRS
jgi:hypothetical protein